ncbi:putative ribonuclease H-like domain-containing protein [Tanacetum coccineum]
MVPKAVLVRPGLVSLTTAKPVNTAQPITTVNSARPMTTLSKSARSTDKNVNTAKPKAVVNAAKPKVVVNAAKPNNVNAVKASACWVWKPKTKVLDHGNPQMDLQDQGVIDSGCSRHMTRNMSYLRDYEEIDGGYVAFGGNLKRGKITGRGKFDGKADEGFFVVYSINSKAFRVFNSRTSIVEENLNRANGNAESKDVMMQCKARIKDNDDEDVGAEADMNNLDALSVLFQLQEYTKIIQLVAQGYTQEEGIDYDEVFTPVARIEAIRLFLANASFKDFVVYQMDVKSAFLYGKIEEGVYVYQPPGFEDPDFPDIVYKVEKALYGLHQAPRAWYETLSTYLLDNGFQRGKIDKSSFIRKNKGQPKLGLWYPKDSPFDLVAYTDSDYAGASLDRKSTTGGCQFLGSRLISWQCKKQTVVANSIREAEYVVKTVNGEVQLQALVDRKKIIVTEASVRRDLQLNDEEELTRMGYEKLSQKLTFYKAFFSPQWKFLIHTILQCLSAKTTAWNEFSSTMASVIICLATNQKFNYSKYIFESMVKNLENVSGKFLMYPRFVQVFLEKQPEGMSNQKRIYVTPSHTKKVFGNMRRVGKGFSGRETPLFPTMMVQAQEEMGEDNVVDEVVYEEMDDSLERAATTTTSLDVEQDRENTKIAQAQEITSLKLRVKKLEKKGRSRTHKLKRLYKVGRSAKVISSNEASLGDQEDASKQGRIADIDADAGINLVLILMLIQICLKYMTYFESSKTRLTKGRINAIDADEDITLVNDQDDADMFNVNTLTGDEVFPTPRKGIVITELAEFDEEERLTREKDEANVALTEEWDDIQAKVNADYQLSQRLQAKEQEQFTTEQKVDDVQETAKVDDDQETIKIKELMEIVPDKEEVAIDAIPLAVKPPSIKLVKAKHGSTRPEDGYERVLWDDLKVMFEPHVKDTVWRNQQDYRVLEWKLYDSCGVHFLRMQHMQIYMLVEKKYHLTPAIITDMLNKKLQCDHFSEMAYQLLKLLTKQLKN